MGGVIAKRLSVATLAMPAALLVSRIEHSILPPRALLARRFATLVVASFILTGVLKCQDCLL